MNNIKTAKNMKTWVDLLDDAFNELTKTFFINNTNSSWSDSKLITALNVELEYTGDLESRIDQLIEESEFWFKQLLKGYALQQSFMRDGLEGRKVLLKIYFNELKPKLRDCNKIYLSNKFVTEFKNNNGGSGMYRQLSAITKICTLTSPLDYWIYDSQASAGLAKFLGLKTTVFSNKYENFHEEMDKFWTEHKTELINYIEKHLDKSLIKSSTLPTQLKDKYFEVLARRLMDKIMMLRNKQVDLYPLSINKIIFS